ncbi:hypothetical protein BDA96_01G364000 [Sorghum bicolor]|uniref:Fe2OG dioxygenase domain-containing protein n=1 Tax=Sorghum bicolor TaxID=4558 RepID=A0A921S277_SORBI|nr:hypothetical protein BDA96_01G364000 [Sorghum bicolor]
MDGNQTRDTKIAGRYAEESTMADAAATAGKLFGREKITDTTVTLFAESANKIPDERFIRTKEVQAAGAVVGEDDEMPLELPVVDMASLVDPDSSASETAKLGSACREWGFFQLTNHGVEEAAMQQMKDSAAEFFRSPLESKNTVAVRDGFQGFGHHFNGGSSEKLDWAECLLLITQPLKDRRMDLWPATNPPTFRHALERYSAEIRNLARRLLGFMATDLGVSQAALLGAFFFAAAGTGTGTENDDKGQSMSMHHYPPWRHPEKVLGIAPHTDTQALTFLLHADDTPGLQVKKDGRWFPVRPLPRGALVVNVGDILDVLTNGDYVSVEHRVVPDAERGRTTVAVFQDACVQGMVTPLPELLLVEGGDAQARYRSVTKLDYLNGSVTALAQGRRFIDSLRK